VASRAALILIATGTALSSAIACCMKYSHQAQVRPEDAMLVLECVSHLDHQQNRPSMSNTWPDKRSMRSTIID
jgi:hypothetical protein